MLGKLVLIIKKKNTSHFNMPSRREQDFEIDESSQMDDNSLSVPFKPLPVCHTIDRSQSVGFRGGGSQSGSWTVTAETIM